VAAMQEHSGLQRSEEGAMGPVGSIDTIGLPDPALFAGVPDDLARRWVQYLYAWPRKKQGPPRLKSHVLCLYDPFAQRSHFPAGLRLCCNVYAACQHRCQYCYARNYIQNPDNPRAKDAFLSRATREVAELRELQLNPVPLHISNSTDPFQEPLERGCAHTLGLVRLIRANRQLFTTVTCLTKNPLLAAEPAYIDMLASLLPCQVEVSVAFYDETHMRTFEPGAPSIASRLEGMARLRQAGIPVSIRIDRLFPRGPLPGAFWPRPRLQDYGVKHTHSLDEIEALIKFASQLGCQKAIVSPLKVPVGRYASRAFRDAFKELYAAPFGGRPRTRSFAWRLPDEYARETLIGEVSALGQRYGIPVVTCWSNLVGTK